MDSTNEKHPFPLLFTYDSPSHLTDAYERWSKSYDKDAECTNYIAPKVTAKFLGELYPNGSRTVRILAIGAGTGLVGVELQKLGFNTIDGLEPCPSMLDKARATHAYSNLFVQFFTACPTPCFHKDSYDVIVSSGSLLQNHLPPDCFIEATRLVRPGGIICMITRSEGPGSFNEPGYKDQFVTVIKQLEEERKLEKITWEQVHDSKLTMGVLIAYKVLQ